MARFLKLSSIQRSGHLDDLTSSSNEGIDTRILVNIEQIVSIGVIQKCSTYPKGGSFITTSGIDEDGASIIYYVDESFDTILNSIPV